VVTLLKQQEQQVETVVTLLKQQWARTVLLGGCSWHELFVGSALPVVDSAPQTAAAAAEPSAVLLPPFSHYEQSMNGGYQQLHQSSALKSSEIFSTCKSIFVAISRLVSRNFLAWRCLQAAQLATSIDGL